MLLTKAERNRIQVMQAVRDSTISVTDAARLLGKSRRQIFRLLAKVKASGAAITAVLHGNKGRAAPNRHDEQVWQHVVTLAEQHYHAVNDRHLQELLKREHSIDVGRESLRLHLRAAGIAPKRKRRPHQYRARRERRAAFGMLLQIDASPHDWLEGRGPRLTLVGAKDDAAGYAWCRFVEAETTWAYLGLMREICLADGIPLALYSDRHTIFHSPREPTIIEQLANRQPLTQFGRAMEELGIHIIKAHSPQAKGRIERLWGVLQDRLVVELRFAGAMTIREANRVLDRFMRDYNQRFTVAAALGRSRLPACATCR